MALSVLEEHSLVLHNILPLKPGCALPCHPVPLACSKHSGRIYVEIQTLPPHCLLEVFQHFGIVTPWNKAIKSSRNLEEKSRVGESEIHNGNNFVQHNYSKTEAINLLQYQPGCRNFAPIQPQEH